MKKIQFAFLAFVITAQLSAQSNVALEKAIAAMEPQSMAWQKDLHEHPELGNREFKTAKLIATYLRSLGLEVKESVAHTGVVGILKGAKPGPVIGLRADMDALPVVEQVKIPYASKEKTVYNGQEVGVMHACGHDTHVSMLMSVAAVLSGMKNELAGTVKFIFQPAEEGLPQGEEGGAPLMVKENVLDNPKVDVMFGLHINSRIPIGQIKYRSGSIMASSDWFTIKIKGKQSHGGQPWLGIDPVAIGAQVIQGLQMIVSRQTELTKNAVVISTTMFTGGARPNIIPAEVSMGGTIRTFDPETQQDVWARMKRTATSIAEASGATAEVEFTTKTLVTYNNPELTQMMLPSLLKAANNKATVTDPTTWAEDFSYFAAKVPSMYFYIGGLPPGMDPEKAAPHHTPDFYVDPKGMQTGIRAFCYLVLDYMKLSGKTPKPL